jgi:molybdopterin-binding protein
MESIPKPVLQVKGLSVRFEGFSLKDVSFDVAAGEYFVILGLSGAGKTVIMEAIAGLIPCQNGTIVLNGLDITLAPIGKRRVGLLFQDYAIFPHLSVYGNIAYALRSRGLCRSDIKRRVTDLAEDAGITHLLRRKPQTLSGGELQRVALCRTLAHDPEVLLLDEPFSALDVAKKDEFRNILRSINKSGKTILHITHDFHEAISLAHRIAVIENGTLVQTGTPEEIFRFPASDFIAKLSGVRNFYSARAEGDSGIKLPGGNVLMYAGETLFAEGYVMIRPAEVVLSEIPIKSSMTNNFTGKVNTCFYTPNGYEVAVDAGFMITATITPSSFEELKIIPGKTIHVSFKASAVHFVPSSASIF